VPNEGIPQVLGRSEPDRLRDANERLTLQALQAQEQAEESARRYQHEHDLNALLLKKQGQLRSLTSELMSTEQRERKRLATELHDHLGQMMVLGRLKIAQMRAEVMAAEGFFSHVVGDLDAIFMKSLAYIRTLMAELIPPVLYELGLPSALRWLAEQMPGQHQLTVAIDLAKERVPLPDDQALFLYHAVRELLLNVVRHAHTSQAMVSLSVEGGNLRIVVKDNGQGFEPASLETRPEGEQFGLFTIRERIEALGGSVEVNSAPSQGTAIALTLPLVTPRQPDVLSLTATVRSLKQAGASSQPSVTRRLLLVDDHAMVRQGLRAILETYQDLSVVGEATNGLEALSMASDADPDVILMDVNMPQMDGIEATKRIKLAHPDIVVIGLSVNTSPAVMDAMEKAGAAAFVSKDAAGDRLYDTINDLTERPPKFIEPEAA
jgi:signal transduction histidine kinase/ActR/RegA family two-component response regulator